MLRLSDEWKDYECIDAGYGEKLERWKDVILRRPDPQAIWATSYDNELWENAHGHYFRSSNGGGHWEFKKQLKEFWTVKYKHLTFKVSPTNFKHTGLFPEQAANWDFMYNKIKSANRKIKVLNLFAYTGGAVPLMLSFLAYNTPLIKIINLDLIATEIVRALSGSIGLIIAVPITSLAAGILYGSISRGRISRGRFS